MEILERLDGQVGIHGARAIAEQEREVHHLARLAGLDDQGHLVARLFPNQVIVHRRERQKARDRRVGVIHAAVGKNQHGVAGLDGQRRAGAQRVERALELFFSAVGAEERRKVWWKGNRPSSRGAAFPVANWK